MYLPKMGSTFAGLFGGTSYDEKDSGRKRAGRPVQYKEKQVRANFEFYESTNNAITIEATVGRITRRKVLENLIEADVQRRYICQSCGFDFIAMDETLEPKYCPRCKKESLRLRVLKEITMAGLG